MCILQIGELSGKFTHDFYEETSKEIPWNKIRSMRNRFAHGYQEMSIEKIWDVAINYIPPLSEFCNNILEKINVSEESADWDLEI